MQRQSIPSILSFALAIGVIVAAILGPLMTGLIRFHLPDSLVNQYVGGEVVTLFVAAPAFMLSGVLWRRGDALAPALAMGPAAYTVYTFVTAIVGQEYGTYDGNAERAFLLYAALIAGGSALAVFAARDMLRHDAPPLPARLRNSMATVFLLVAMFFALAWIGQVVQVYRGNAPAEYTDGPTLFWLVKMMDLGFLLPAFAVAGIGLLRRTLVAARLSFGMISYAVCMTVAILGMAVAMWLKDDPSGSVAMISVLAPVSLGLAALAWRALSLYRDAGNHPASSPSVGAGHA